MRHYKAGEPITSINELLKCEFIVWNDKTYHIGWVKSWQLNFILLQIEQRRIFKAVKIVNEELEA